MESQGRLACGLNIPCAVSTRLIHSANRSDEKEFQLGSVSWCMEPQTLLLPDGIFQLIPVRVRLISCSVGNRSRWRTQWLACCFPIWVSSAESVGERGYWESAEGVVERDLYGVVLSVAVGGAEDYFGFMIQPCCEAIGIARSSYYRARTPKHGPQRWKMVPRALTGNRNRRKCSTYSATSDSVTKHQRRLWRLCSMRGATCARSGQCIGCCALMVRCGSDGTSCAIRATCGPSCWRRLPISCGHGILPSCRGRPSGRTFICT